MGGPMVFLYTLQSKTFDECERGTAINRLETLVDSAEGQRHESGFDQQAIADWTLTVKK